MAFELTVVVPVSLYEECSLEEIHGSLTTGILEESYPGLFDYFNRFAESDGYWGHEDPDALRETVNEANAFINKKLDEAFDNVVKSMKDCKVSKPSELPASDLSLGVLSAALQSRTNYFSSPGIGRCVFYDSDGVPTTFPNGKLKQDILSCPEKYAVIDVYYH